jgi:hypothetical protein
MAKRNQSLQETRRAFLRAMGMGTGAALVMPAVPSVGAAPAAAFPDLAALRTARAKRGIIPPNKTYRMMEWEFHTPPEASFHIDVEAAMKASRDAGAESMLFYTQDCWGYAFYPTQVSIQHPNLNFDLFGKEVELAHKLGMSVVAYYCLQFNNQIVLNHPDWAWINDQGEKRRFRWYAPCLDTPYRPIVLGMMEEIFSRYEIDQLFLDVFGIQFWQYHSAGMDPFCYCKFTEEAWNREHPGDPYREGLKTPEGWERRLQWLEYTSMTDLLEKVLAIARKHRPGVLVSLNGGPEQFPNHIMQKVDFIYNEPVVTSTGISLGSMLSRGWGRPDYQAGVFTQFGYIDSIAGSIPRVQADALIVQNARTFFVGNAGVITDVDGQGFSKQWFKVAKETWEDVRNVDCLLERLGQPVYSTACFYSEATRQHLDAENRPLDFRNSVLGALENLTYSGRPVESLPDFRLTPELLSQFDVFVLPEVEVLSDAQASLLRDWVKSGGTLVATHKCGLLDEKRRPRTNFPLADVFGVDYVSEEKKYAYDNEGKRKKDFIATYLESVGHPLAQPLGVSTVGLPGSFLHVQRTTAEEVMRYRLPTMIEDLSKDKWFNWGPPPPGRETVPFAMAYNKVGQGQCVFAGAPIFQAMSHHSGWAVSDRPFWVRDWFRALLPQLRPNPMIELASLPFTEYLHGSFFYDQDKRLILVQALNTLELATKGKFHGPIKAEIRINPKRLNVSAARLVWPSAQDLAIRRTASKMYIPLPGIARYTALYLKLG